MFMRLIMRRGETLLSHLLRFLSANRLAPKEDFERREKISHTKARH
jgi:hypothetical protein